MAFVHRTTRAASKADARYETPAHVGPGAYKVRSTFGRVRPSYAPFGSTGVRKQPVDEVKLVTPGPGSYDEQKPPVFSVSGNASSFRSATRRFAGVGASGGGGSDGPGPGQYDASAAADRLARQGRIKSVPHARAQQRPAHNPAFRVAGTAPSIPGRFDQHGYDETPDGRLRKQVSPHRGHKGRDGDTVGPGEYRVSKPIGSSARGGADFARSTSTRPQNVTMGDAAHIGPGYYDLSGEGNARYKRPPAPSGAFKSKTQRSDPGASLSGVSSPGPGAYIPPSAFKTEKKKAHLQFFGSSSSRFDDRTLRSAGGAPGPGTYKLGSGFRQRSSTGHGRRPQEPGVGFTGSSSRFQTKYETLGAGPARTSPDVYSFTNQLERKPTGRCTSFGTTTKKFFEPRDRGVAPGPGAYADAATDSPQTKLQAMRKSSSMASSVKRFKPPRNEMNPEPGAYDVNKKWTAGKRRTGTMRYGPDRFSTAGSGKVDSPGPGAYEAPSTLKQAPPNRKNILQTTGPRFQPSESVYAQPKPGPGTYDVEHLYGNMNRPTFNITIAEEMYK